MHSYDYQFSGPIEELDFGRMAYKVIWLPEELEERLPFAQFPRLRIDAEIAGLLTNCAFQIGEKRRYLLLASDFLKQAGVKLGEKVLVRFSVADQTAVEVPYDFELALQHNLRAKKLWAALTPGKQRGFVHRIASAKREETREKRIEEVMEELLNPSEIKRRQTPRPR